MASEIEAKATEDKDIKKVTLRLGPDAIRDLEWLAQKHGGITTVEVFRRAIAVDKYLFEQQELGEVIILENKRTGRQRELVLRLG